MSYTSNRFSAKTIPDEIAARGVGPQSSLKGVYDYGVGIGGPIRQDKLWFYTSNRWWGAQNFGSVIYYNKSTNPYVYDPDLNRRAFADTFFRDNAVRLTWQASAKHKLNQQEHLQYGCSCNLAIGRGALTAPEATTDFQYGPQILSQTTWSYTATNRDRKSVV